MFLWCFLWVFQTELIAIGGMGEVPDILAFYQEGDVLIVGECTVGVPDENKILKLTERAKQLSSASKQVQPVIFSNVKGKMLEEIAVPPEIITVDNEKIREIFNKASRGTSIHDIYHQYFSSRGADLRLSKPS